MFENADKFNGDISKWDTSSATTMQSMFRMALAFDKDLSEWDVSKVSDFSSMFFGAGSLNQDVCSWNVSGGSNFNNMFVATFNMTHNLSCWKNTISLDANVENFASFSSLFSMWQDTCWLPPINFNGPNLTACFDCESNQ